MLVNNAVTNGWADWCMVILRWFWSDLEIVTKLHKQITNFNFLKFLWDCFC